MKLSRENKDKLRREIEKKVKSLSDGETIYLDKELLENLIFEKSKLVNDNKIAKFIVWSGDFLSKIDLKDVNFDNVVWDTEVSGVNVCFIKNWYDKVNKINLKNTNVKIDFSKAFKITNYNKEEQELIINNCSFENVNLTNSHAEVIRYCYNSNFKNTNANLCLNNDIFNFVNCNLEENDLSEFTIDYKILFNSRFNNKSLSDSSLKNTGINIIYDYKTPENLKELVERFEVLKEIYMKNDKQEKELDELYKIVPNFLKLERKKIRFSKLIKDGSLNGTYVNGKFIKSAEERHMTKEKLTKLLNDDTVVYNILNDVDNQIKALKKTNNDFN